MQNLNAKKLTEYTRYAKMHKITGSIMIFCTKFLKNIITVECKHDY